MSPHLKHHLPNLRSLFQRDVRAHDPPSPLDLSVKAPWPACHDLSASVSPHACLSLQVVTVLQLVG